MNNPVDQPKVSELLPCPFCGWAITADEGLCKWDKDEFGDTVDEVTYTGVCCPDCSAHVPINAKSPEEAIEAWNRRSALIGIPGAEKGEIEGLIDGLRQIRHAGFNPALTGAQHEAIVRVIDFLHQVPRAAPTSERVPPAVDRILRAWDAGREVGVTSMRAAVEKMLREWQTEMSAKGLVSENNQGNVLLDRLAALTDTEPKP